MYLFFKSVYFMGHSVQYGYLRDILFICEKIENKKVTYDLLESWIELPTKYYCEDWATKIYDTLWSDTINIIKVKINKESFDTFTLFSQLSHYTPLKCYMSSHSWN